MAGLSVTTLMVRETLAYKFQLNFRFFGYCVWCASINIRYMANKPLKLNV